MNTNKFKPQFPLIGVSLAYGNHSDLFQVSLKQPLERLRPLYKVECIYQAELVKVLSPPLQAQEGSHRNPTFYATTHTGSVHKPFQMKQSFLVRAVKEIRPGT